MTVEMQSIGVVCDDASHAGRKPEVGLFAHRPSTDSWEAWPFVRGRIIEQWMVDNRPVPSEQAVEVPGARGRWDLRCPLCRECLVLRMTYENQRALNRLLSGCESRGHRIVPLRLLVATLT